MTRTICCCACVFLLVCILLASPALAAGGQGPTRASKEAVSLFAWIWQALGNLLPTLSKSSGTMDPDGNPLPGTTSTAPESGTAGTSGDAHGGMDPDGRT